jgi:serralysin
MATVTTFFPGGRYPASYSRLSDWTNWNPSLGDLWSDATHTLTGVPTSTQRLYQLSNGLKVKLIGSGFTVDTQGNALGGTITAIQILQNNGTTLVHSVAGLSRSFQLFADHVALDDGWELGRWLLNGNDVLNGSVGNDDMFGHGGNDVLNGGAGNDYLVGGTGRDTYNGGVGFDYVSFDHNNYDPGVVRGVSVNAQARTVIDNFGYSETFTSIEGFRGSMFADSFIGSAINEDFVPMGGRDVVNGGGGADDWVMYHQDVKRTGGNHGVIVNLTTGVAIDGFGRQDTLLNIESVKATKFNDVLTGSAVTNYFNAGPGNDIIIGLAGNDFLGGGAGRDTMTGGLGNDRFDYWAATDSLVGANADIIKDFDDSGDDRIGLSDLFGPAMVYRGTLAFSGAGQVRINDIAGVDLLVEVNLGGTLAADMQIRLSSTDFAAMAASDFFL